MLDLGRHRLKDLSQPEHIRQLVMKGLPSEFPPLKSLEVLPPELPLGMEAVQLPAFLGKADPAELLLEIIENVDPAADRESRLRELMGLMACKGAVKAGDRLPGDEIRALLERGRGIDFSGACAHGRPTRILLSVSDIEKMFERK